MGDGGTGLGTHHETGTGVLNPIREIGALAHAHGAAFVVDTTSTYAMLPFSMEEANIDFCMASAQKGIQAMTGLSFVIGRTSLIEASKDYPVRSYYCNLYQQYAYFEKTGQMQFTPPRLAHRREIFLDLLLGKRRKLYGRDHRWKTCSLRRMIGRSGDLSRGQKSE